MAKRYIAAFLFSILLLLVYPYYLKWIAAPSEKTGTVLEPSLQELPETISPPPAAPRPPVTATTHRYENRLYELIFSSRGGTVVFFKQGDAVFYEAEPDHTGIFGLKLFTEAQDLSQENFRVGPNPALGPSPQSGAPPEFGYEKPGEYRLTKRFFVGDTDPTLVLEVEIENLSEREKHFPLGLHYALEPRSLHSYDEPYLKTVVFAAGETRFEGYGRLKKHPFVVTGPLEWQGLLRKYYAILVKPDTPLLGQETRVEENRLVSELRFPPATLGPQEKKTTRILIYAGPQRYETLKTAGFGFEKILLGGWFGWVKLGVLIGLNFFYRLAQNYGVAILVVTFLIKLLFAPLTHMSYESMKKMQALQPKLKALQQQYAKDPSRLNKETTDLYRRNRVNPLGGCLPLVLQIPIFIAFYQVLSEAVDLKGASFLWWIRDLSEPDRLFTLPFILPFVGDSFNLLPILMIGSMLWQQKLTPQTAATPGQEKMMYFMPIIFGFVFYGLPSGLVLYWLANNLLTIFHQLFIKRVPVILHHEDR